MRLDFNTLSISGPSTDTNPVGNVQEGELNAAGNAACAIGQGGNSTDIIRCLGSKLGTSLGTDSVLGDYKFRHVS